MTVCIACKKEFGKTDEHHISYQTGQTVRVCRKCHNQIHRTEKYPHLKPIDHYTAINADIDGNQELKNQNLVHDANSTIGKDNRIKELKAIIYANSRHITILKAEIKFLKGKIKMFINIGEKTLQGGWHNGKR